MKHDCHDNLPPELLLSWTPEQLDYMHDVSYWTETVSKCKGADVISVKEMESNDEVWADWLAQDNEYAAGDRKSMEAGGGKHLNFFPQLFRNRLVGFSPFFKIGTKSPLVYLLEDLHDFPPFWTYKALAAF